MARNTSTAKTNRNRAPETAPNDAPAETNAAPNAESTAESAATAINTHTFKDRADMEMTYEETDFTPSRSGGRVAQENPHVSGVKKAIEMMTTAPTKRLNTPALPNDMVKTHINWLRTAGEKEGVTIRVETVPVEGTETSKVYFRAVKRITRQRGKKNETATTATPETPATETPETPATDNAETPAESVPVAA